jgi:broad specificity phosphatase PhoE
MKKAALYINEHIVIGDSHLDAYSKLSPAQKESVFISGTFNQETGEFEADMLQDHFYQKSILLIRHARVTNADEPDPELCDIGIQETHAMCQQLKRLDLEGFVGFTSPLLRCLQTTKIISQTINIPFIVDPTIMETPGFLSENDTFILKNRCKEFSCFEWNQTEDWDIAYEEFDMFIDRIRYVLQQLPIKSILISHCGFITNMARLALCEEKIEACGLPTASLTYIENHKVKCLGRTASYEESC